MECERRLAAPRVIRHRGAFLTTFAVSRSHVRTRLMDGWPRWALYKDTWEGVMELETAYGAHFDHLHTHSVFEGSATVLKSKAGGSLTFKGCLEMLTRPLTALWLILLIHWEIYHIPCISVPCDLILDSGRIINISFDRTFTRAKTPPIPIYSIRVNDKLPVQFLFFIKEASCGAELLHEWWLFSQALMYDRRDNL